LNSILICLLANFSDQRTVTKLAREKRKKQQHDTYKKYNIYNDLCNNNNNNNNNNSIPNQSNNMK
jgi:hypothetical protein